MANEKRLIDANALKDDFRRYMAEKYDREICVSEESCITCGRVCLFQRTVNNAPTVDAVEVVHAEWVCVNESENVWMCTGDNGCGNEILLLEGTPSENGWHYCPHCGAKMDGGNEDG